MIIPENEILNNNRIRTKDNFATAKAQRELENTEFSNRLRALAVHLW